MDANTKAMLRIIFRNKVYETRGQAYENFFTSIMSLAVTEFQQIKPQGAHGDRKNDGFVKGTGEYYQVYAPDDAHKADTKARAVQKAINDFAGLYQHWNSVYPIKKYYFVINDGYRGVFPELEAGLANIRKQYNLEDAKPFTAKDLEKVLFGLEDDQILSVIQWVPVQIADETNLAKKIVARLSNKRAIHVMTYQDIYSEAGYAVESVLKIQEYLENMLSNIDPDSFLSKKIDLMIKVSKRFLSEMQRNKITTHGSSADSPANWWENYTAALTTFRNEVAYLLQEISILYDIKLNSRIDQIHS